MSIRVIELCIKLLGQVPEKKSKEPVYAKTLPHGFVTDQKATYATREIIELITRERLTPEQLNATFHKSWKVIKGSSRLDLFVHQVQHYLSTYGTNFQSDVVYLPPEKLELPESSDKVAIRVIRGETKGALIQGALEMIQAGIALSEETIEEILELLELLGYEFHSVEAIENKEALVRVIAATGIYPKSPTEFLRYLVYLSTGSTLLIKDSETIEAIKNRKLDISSDLNAYGLKRCAEVFKRFKPLWLAFKSHKYNVTEINEISRLSRKFHRPMTEDVLNNLTSVGYAKKVIREALDRANNFRKIRLINALNSRLSEADVQLYRIRNGKSFVRSGAVTKDRSFYQDVKDMVYDHLIKSVNLKGKRIKYPTQIDYALPTSEKNFVGHYPMGTKITAKNLVAGVYWENNWGAKDLDLSALQLGIKVGWNSDYQSEGLLYSGDMTDAREGATELMYTKTALDQPALTLLNIYSGVVGCKFKVIIGNAPEVVQNHMFSPDELLLEAASNTISRQQIIGIFLPGESETTSFLLVNTGFGNLRVSSGGVADQARKALYYQYTHDNFLKKFLLDAGALLVEEEMDIDLSPENLTKKTLIHLFA